MIVFIDLEDKIQEGIHEFCFFNTANRNFKTFAGVQTWETAEEFMMDFAGEEEDINRYLDRVPDKFYVRSQK